MMTDDRMDALIRRLDVPATPDPAFVAATANYLRPRVRAARVEDMTRLGRLRRDLRLGLAGRTTWTRPPLAVVFGLVLLAAFAAALAAGALDRRHDLLQDVRGAGTLRVAVRPDRPQGLGRVRRDPGSISTSPPRSGAGSASASPSCSSPSIR